MKPIVQASSTPSTTCRSGMVRRPRRKPGTRRRPFAAFGPDPRASPSTSSAGPERAELGDLVRGHRVDARHRRRRGGLLLADHLEWATRPSGPCRRRAPASWWTVPVGAVGRPVPVRRRRGRPTRRRSAAYSVAARRRSRSCGRSQSAGDGSSAASSVRIMGLLLVVRCGCVVTGRARRRTCPWRAGTRRRHRVPPGSLASCASTRPPTIATKRSMSACLRSPSSAMSARGHAP